MKRLIVFLLIASLLMNIPASVLAQTNLEKYKKEERNPGLSLFVSLVFGWGLGHAVAGDFERGLKFFGTELLGMGLLMLGSSLASGGGGLNILAGYLGFTAGLGVIITRFNEMGDAAGTAIEYNEMLKKKYDIDITPKDDSSAI